MEVVHDDATYSVVQGTLKLIGRLVVAVEVDGLRWEAHGLCYCQLSARYHVQPQALFVDESRQGRVNERLGRIHHPGVGITSSELAHELAAHVPEGGLVEDVKGRAELGHQVYGIAATQH